MGGKLFAGVPSRTNSEGIRQLDGILKPYDYEIIPVRVTGCLHLKSAVTFIGRNTLLANRAWIDTEPFASYGWIDVAREEPRAATAVALRGTRFFPSSLPLTRALLASPCSHASHPHRSALPTA